MVCSAEDDASSHSDGKDANRFGSGTISSRLISRALLPLNNVAEVSLEWSLVKPSKYVLCLVVALVVLFGTSISLNMFLFRRVTALETEMESVRRLIDDLVVAKFPNDIEQVEDDVEISLTVPSDVDTELMRDKRQARSLPTYRDVDPENTKPRRKRAGDSENRISSATQNMTSLETNLDLYSGANAGAKGVQFRPCLKAVLKSDSSGLVTGWHPDWAADPFRYQFDALRSQVTIKEDGLYFVYSQLYFFHSFEVTGYEVFLSRSDTALAAQPNVIAKCSLTGSHPGATADTGERSEASCYTSAVVPLSRGDSIFIRVRELERYLNLARGHSYMGLVKLGRHPGKKRTRRGHAFNDPQCPAN